MYSNFQIKDNLLLVLIELNFISNQRFDSIDEKYIKRRRFCSLIDFFLLLLFKLLFYFDYT